MAVEVLSGNTAAIEFYKALGFRDYSVTLEIPAEEG
jgi:ribosomal protein S18 acetylase RimI-like enzyme